MYNDDFAVAYEAKTGFSIVTRAKTWLPKKLNSD